MKTVVVLAPGPSLDQETADYVRGKCPVVAVSNAYHLAPWADALVSHDRRWWRCYDAALKFAGRKVCYFALSAETEIFAPAFLPPNCNSGLMGMYFAQHELGAEKVILAGFDMHGTHFFGRHPDHADMPPEKRLKNTSEERRKTFLKDFAAWRGCEVINCTPGSAIKAFPFGNLKDMI